jgi:mevalonate kinase
MATGSYTLNPLNSGIQPHSMASPLRANAKFLLSGEYLVLDGAWALAIPLKFGQTLHIDSYPGDFCLIESREANLQPWFQATFHPGTGLVMESTNEDVALQLERLLQVIPAPVKREFLKAKKLIFTVDFQRNWGLGSSSTLVSLLSQYLHQNPYTLLQASFKGSGYDIACATARQPILYRLNPPEAPSVQPVELKAELLQHLHFFYLGKKALSSGAVLQYSQLPLLQRQQAAAEISELTLRMHAQQTVEEWSRCISKHNSILSALLQQPNPANLFPDAPGPLKPMGAWGGDFMLGIGDRQEWQHFAAQHQLQPCWQASEAIFQD